MTSKESKYSSNVTFISGLVTFIPAKNPTPSNTINNIDKNRLKLFLISIK